jgi:hypothetical protein
MVNPIHGPILTAAMHFLLLFLALSMAGCCSKEGRACKQNIKGEYIYRLHDEYFFKQPAPVAQTREKYPWEERYIGHLPRITKDFFRCKGDPLNPAIVQSREGKEPIKYFDCLGGKKHGLPLKEGSEFVYPCLLDILNYLQQKTGKKVVITCGHRCPKHNVYVDHAPSNWGSKHMIGAEVDFYVEGLEHEPESIVALIQQFYAEKGPFTKEFTQFKRYDKEGLNVSSPPWYNKEIFVKLYLPHEGRDLDNQHAYPYLGIQVRYDRSTDSKVVFDQKQAQNYLRQ